MENMDGKSLDITMERINRLKDIFPEAVTEGEIDWDVLRLALGDGIATGQERYGLSWPGKAEAFQTIQEQTTATLVPVREESIDFDETEHVFIEGENFEVLKVLQKAYFGKVKVIVIDVPYNTGNDSFVYPDNFAERKEAYLKRINEMDDSGYLNKDDLFRKNAKESGHFHSNWLGMMYPRLYLARNLLREDGVIFVHIDDHEVHNLRHLMDEVFGTEHFIGMFVWQSKKGGGSDSGTVVTDQEYVLSYGKSTTNNLSRILIEAEPLDCEDEKGAYRRGRELNKWGSGSRREDRPTMYFPIPGPNSVEVYPIRNDGDEGRWRWGKKKMSAIVERGDVEFVQRSDGTYIVYEKIRSRDQRLKPYRTLLPNVGTTADGSKTVKELFDGKKVFDFPKPVELVKQIITMGANIVTTNSSSISLGVPVALPTPFST
jgi:adenine-specific DNA-methyltransferase